MSGHLLKTINPEAAEEADSGWRPAGPPLVEDVETVPMGIHEGVPFEEVPVLALPSVGMDVVYHLRDGDARNMRTKFPAVVLDADSVTRTLSIVVTVDAGDLWRQDRVPQYAPPEAGWDWIGHIRETAPAPGAAPKRGPDLMEMFTALSDRISLLEAKRGPGRPPKLRDE
jgi:hypothetical protein